MESLIKFVKPKFDHENFTHVLNISNKNFPCQLGKEDMIEFWELVSGCGQLVSVKERFQAINKVVMSIDYQQEELEETEIKRITFALQLAVRTILDIKDNDEILTTIVQKENKNLTLIMPFCHVDYNVLRKELREAFIYVLDTKQILGKTHATMVNKKIYDSVCLVTLPFDDLICYNALDAESIGETNSITIYDVLNENKNYKDVYSLISFTSKAEEETKKKNVNQKDRRTISINERVAERIREKVQTDTELLSELVVFLDKNRCNTHNGFLEVGQCIFNITSGSETGLSLWCKIAEESEKSDLCHSEWKHFEKTQTTIGTFRYWCSRDDPEGYKEWKNQSLETLLWTCLDPTAGYTDIAELLYRKYEDKFVCSSIKDQLWYEYKHHRYQELDGAVTIRIKLSSDLVKDFNNILNECNSSVEQAPDGPEKTKWSDKQSKCIQIITGLKNPSYKSNIMKEASEKFYDPDFSKEINQNKMLFCFDNGVFDCNSCTLRPGRPQDRITISCGYDFQHYTWDHPDVVFCMDYLKKVFVDREVREYFVRFCASCLEAGNKDKLLPVLTGVGNNSKSIIELLLEKCFGDYFVKGPTSLITYQGTSNPGSATPELEILRFARLTLFQEPKATDKLNDSIVKQLSSGFDSMYSRALNKMPTKMVPMFKAGLVCNKIPHVDTTDPAIMNRLRIIAFKSVFSHTYPDTVEEQFKKRIFPIDLDFDRKIPLMIKPFMWILTQEYPTYKKNGLVAPELVVLETDKYRMTNDTFKEFIEEKVEVVTDEEEIKKTFIKSDQLYQTFKLWFKDNFPSSQVPNSSDMKYQMHRKGYEIKALRYYGLKLRSQ